MNRLKTLTNGIIKENPALVLVLGTCPTLALTTQAVNGIGMGVAVILVLLGSNVAISMLRKIIPDKVKIPCYIVIIAGFVTVVSLLVQAYTPAIYKALGIYLPLIVVNCIILGRAEMFASKNTVLDSALDAIGMGIGFMLALTLMGIPRELIGSGTLYGYQILPKDFETISVFVRTPGGFFVFGSMIALVNWLTKGRGVKRKEFGCEGCPSAGACSNAGKGGC